MDGKVLVCDGKSDDQICTICGIVAHGLVKRDSREREREREATAAAAEAAEAGCLGWIMDRRLELRMN